MYCLDNQIELLKQPSTDFVDFYNDDYTMNYINQEYEASIVSSDELKSFEEFFLYEENDQILCEPVVEVMTPTKAQSDSNDCKDLKYETSVVLQVDFNNGSPDMDDFLFKIKEEIIFKGISEVICDALDIKDEQELQFEASDFIKIKKRKSKEQIVQLEQEFAITDDWDKDSMNFIAAKLNLDPAQVYKWHWDQISKKLGKAPKRKAKLQKALE
jgi:hypothetical protein